jgi:hypothetical protein
MCGARSGNLRRATVAFDICRLSSLNLRMESAAQRTQAAMAASCCRTVRGPEGARLW